MEVETLMHEVVTLHPNILMVLVIALTPPIAVTIALIAAVITIIIGAILFVFFHKQPDMRLLLTVNTLAAVITITPIAEYYIYQWLLTTTRSGFG